ncbi:uncharacterized protein LOC120924346 isoform X1 [Rana temporaria]|uniref:uncharacterized protein LOC120924346 isoform X1 n=1 Tax=Rana temporaria TaxID=8407 RepID=UPI001AADC35D|nr:uncharacterized protein LOC120924346 isoform X1 [Rana temporaria]
MYMPIKTQLQTMLENTDLYDIICATRETNSNGFIKDITDGKYRSITENIQGSFLTLSFNCDGVPVFKSSKSSMWPTLFVINEVPLSVRKSNVLMASLWFGRSDKPPMSVLLTPFVNEVKTLSRDGFYWKYNGETMLMKVFALLFISDAVARPLVQKFNQFNGAYGCGFCLQEGKVVERGRGTARVYKFEQPLLRQAQETLQHAEMAIHQGKPVFGVKGVSLLFDLPYFNVIDCVVPEYMHCVLLGVARQLATLWFDTKFHTKDFYLGMQRNEINRRLLQIQPPCNFARVPRSIDVRKFWKAHEWLAWLVYYSVPVLWALMHEQYFVNWCRLVGAIGLLSSECVSTEDLASAQQMLEKFVSDMEPLYGLEHVSFNIHSCVHMTQAVTNWGPLWAQSAFQFEAFNGVLLRLIKSSNAVVMQICNSYLKIRNMPLYEKEIMHTAITPINKLYSAMKDNSKEVCYLEDSVQALGPCKTHPVSRSHFIALHSVLEVVKQNMIARYYNCVAVNKKVFHASSNKRITLRNSNTAILNTGDFFTVESYLVLDNSSTCFAIGRFLTIVSDHAAICRDREVKLGHLVLVNIVPGHLVAIPASSLKNKCVFIKTTNAHYAVVGLPTNPYDLNG